MLLQLFLRQFFALIGYIANFNSFPKALNAKEEEALLERYKNRDTQAKNLLIEHNLRLVAHIAKKYAAGGQDSDDTISIGTIGLIKGINSYDFDKGTKLSTYIARCIENEILMSVRANKKLQNEVSIEEPIGVDCEGNQITFNDILSDDDDEILDAVNLKLVRSSLCGFLDSVLTEREKLIIMLRYGLCGHREWTQKEVAKRLKISRSYVSRIEKRAIEKLNQQMRFQEL